MGYYLTQGIIMLTKRWGYLNNNAMSSALDKLDVSFKVPLSVQFIAKYLKAGRSQAEISRIAGVTPQAVNDYIHKRYELFEPLLDRDDTALADLSKLVAIKAQRNLTALLDDTPEKKDLIALNAISGTHIDKYRLLSGKSTENTLNLSLIVDLNEFLKQLKDAS